MKLFFRRLTQQLDIQNDFRIAANFGISVFGILLSPMLAAAAMSLSSVSVISNALRLRNVKL